MSKQTPSSNMEPTVMVGLTAFAILIRIYIYFIFDYEYGGHDIPEILFKITNFFTIVLCGLMIVFSKGIMQIFFGLLT